MRAVRQRPTRFPTKDLLELAGNAFNGFVCLGVFVGLFACVPRSVFLDFVASDDEECQLDIVYIKPTISLMRLAFSPGSL